MTSGNYKNSTVIKDATETNEEISRYSYYYRELDSYVLIDEVISGPRKGHNYSGTFDSTSVFAGDIVNLSCSNSDCTNRNLQGRIARIVESNEIPGNCQNYKKVIYQVKLTNGEYATLYTTNYASLGACVLNGLAVDSQEFIEKYVDSDTGAIRSDTPGVCMFADVENKCGKVYEGFIVCELCDSFYSVTILTVHKSDYSLLKNETDHSAVTFSVVGTCEICGDYFIYQDVKMENIVITIDKPDRCLPGKKTYSYTASSGEVLQYTELINPNSNHFLNGLDTSSAEFKVKYCDSISGAIKSNTPGINSFADYEFVAGEIVAGWYLCEYCNSAVSVDVYCVDN